MSHPTCPPAFFEGWLSAKANETMDVVLHCGAHRTGAAGLQDYLRRHAGDLREQGVDFCGPEETRRGLFAGVTPCVTAQRARNLVAPLPGRLALRLQRAKSRGAHKLLVSDADLLGGLCETAEAGILYPDAGARVARYATVFPNGVTEVLICVRSLEMFWISLFSRALILGASVPDRARLRQIAHGDRSWRDVVTEVARALPDARIKVLAFERFRGQPERLLGAALDCGLPLDRQRSWMNRAPHLPELRRKLAERGEAPGRLPFGMGHWNPFCSEELSALRELYSDDMMWLVGGAGGLATLTEERPGKRAEKSPPSEPQPEGHSNAIEERQMARPG